MARTAAPDIETAGNDSFLDVVSNIVGILIILVLVTGLRVKQAPVPVAARSPELVGSLGEAQRENATLEGDVRRLDAQIESIRQETRLRRSQRELLAALLARAEKELQAERGKLSASAQRQFDAERELEMARLEAGQLQERRVQLASLRPDVRKIDSYPTALSTPVDGKEVHCQLRNGRVTVIPLEELVARFRQHAAERVHKLRDQAQWVDTVGPVDDFYLRYALERVEPTQEMALRTGRTGAYTRLRKWELLPVSTELGETLEQALSTQSLLRAKLDTAKPPEWSITLWTYPDSFDLYRALRKELYTLGYTVAGRPLPFGIPISGSPSGTRSAAQ